MPFEPMLASAVTDVNLIQFPVLASPKLDGIRCVVRDGVALTRSLKEVPNRHVQHLFGRHRFDGLDGELIMGKATAKEVFQRTTSAVMCRTGEPNVKFYVFDHTLVHDHPFTQRYTDALRLVATYADPADAVMVPHNRITSVEALLKYEARLLKAGFEGVMLRNPAGVYKHGRSTLREGTLLKLKRFTDSEATIIGYEEGTTNTNAPTLDERGRSKRSSHASGKLLTGTLGTLLVRDCVTAVEFRIGTGQGLTAPVRAALWGNRRKLLGKVVKYRYQAVGVKVAPRLPVLMGFRDKLDM